MTINESLAEWREPGASTRPTSRSARRINRLPCVPLAAQPYRFPGNSTFLVPAASYHC